MNVADLHILYNVKIEENRRFHISIRMIKSEEKVANFHIV